MLAVTPGIPNHLIKDNISRIHYMSFIVQGNIPRVLSPGGRSRLAHFSLFSQDGYASSGMQSDQLAMPFVRHNIFLFVSFHFRE